MSGLSTRPAPESLLPGRLTETGLDLPEGMAFEDWQRTLELLGRMDRGLKWAVVDCYMYGERTYGEPAAQFAESIGWAPQTLLNAISLWRAFPPDRRHPRLSFGHHDAVVGLPETDRAEMLELAEYQGWSVSTLRATVRIRQGKLPVTAPLGQLGDDLASAVHAYLTAYRDAQRRPGVDLPDITGLETALAAWDARRGMGRVDR